MLKPFLDTPFMAFILNKIERSDTVRKSGRLLNIFSTSDKGDSSVASRGGKINPERIKKKKE